MSVVYLANDLWHHGPEWITKENLWPKWKAEPISVYTTQVEAVEEKLPPTQMSVECLFDISRVSTLLKLLRITAFVLRFIDRCKQSGDRPSVQSFSVEELSRAEKLWIASCQHECFQQEQESITLGCCQPPIVRQLKLFVDRDGLLRSGGRLHNAP